MKIEFFPSQRLDMHLERGQILSSPRLDGLTIEVRKGSVWITFEKEGVDHVLNPGERLLLGTGGHAVIESLDTADLVLGTDQPSGVRRCIHQLTDDLPRCTRQWLQSLSPSRLSLETL